MKKIPKNQNLFLISIHRKPLLEIYDKSVTKPISKKIFEKYNLAKIIQKKNGVAVWGLINTEENYKIWKNIQNSDLIMFFDGKKLFSKTRVIETREDNYLPKKIWSESSFLENRNLLIFLDAVESIELEYDACIPTLIEPKIPNAYYFPIKQIDTKKKKLLETTFGNLENAIDFLANAEKKNLSISEYLSEKEIIDEVPIILKPGISKQRIGQSRFRKNVLLNFGSKCAICETSDGDLLQAAHIIPVTDKNLSGKTNNGICFCLNCHKMFDAGFFSFNEKYEVIISKQKKISKKMLTILKNKKMGKYKIPPSKEYLGLHKARFGIS